MVEIVKGTETDKWLHQSWRKSTFQILRQPAKTSEDLVGSAFLLSYRGVPYIVSAKHVIDIENPVVVFPKKDRKRLGVPTSEFERVGLKWIEHPAGLDLVAMPFHLPLNSVEELDIIQIPEGAWLDQPDLKEDDDIAHLGYPEKGTSIYTDGTSASFPQGMPGKIISIGEQHIEMETASARGASGGPVFLKAHIDNPTLIGVAISTRMYGNPARPDQAIYFNKTTALTISSIKEILESDEMIKQYQERKIDETWL